MVWDVLAITNQKLPFGPGRPSFPVGPRKPLPPISPSSPVSPLKEKLMLNLDLKFKQESREFFLLAANKFFIPLHEILLLLFIICVEADSDFISHCTIKHEWN